MGLVIRGLDAVLPEGEGGDLVFRTFVQHGASPLGHGEYSAESNRQRSCLFKAVVWARGILGGEIGGDGGGVGASLRPTNSSTMLMAIPSPQTADSSSSSHARASRTVGGVNAAT